MRNETNALALAHLIWSFADLWEVSDHLNTYLPFLSVALENLVKVANVQGFDIMDLWYVESSTSLLVKEQQLQALASYYFPAYGCIYFRHILEGL